VVSAANVSLERLVDVDAGWYLYGGSRGTSPSLDLTFPPTGLSENLGGMESGGEGKGKGKGGETTCLISPTPTGFCLKYHPVWTLLWLNE